MKIKRIRFRGFGHYLDREFVFSNGINLIEAPNESGKSTLIQGIFALLYGRNREGYRKKTKAEWFEQYHPWSDKSVYGGEVEYQIKEESFQLFRALIDDDQQLIKLATGEEITNQFPFDQKKERRYLDEQIGLSGEVLKRISFINSLSFSHRSTATRAVERDRELIHRFTLLLRQGDEIDIDPVIEDLKREIDSIGSQPQAQSTPFGQVCQRIKHLQLEIHELEDIKQLLHNEEEQWKKMDEEAQNAADYLQELEQEMQQREWVKQMENQQLEACHQLENMYIKLDHYVQREAELDRLRQRKIQLEQHVHDSHFALIDLQDVDRFFHLCQEIESMEKHKIKLQEDQQQLEKIMAKETSVGQDVQQAINESQEMLNRLDQYEHLEELYKRKAQMEEVEQNREKSWQEDRDILHSKENTHIQRHQTRYWLLATLFLLGATLVIGWMNLFAGISIGVFVLLTLIGWVWTFYQRREMEQMVLRKWRVSTVDKFMALDQKWETARSTEDEPVLEWAEHMEEIRQQVRVWLTSYRKEFPSFEPKVWKKEVLFLQRQLQFRLEQEQRRDVQLSFLNIQIDRLHTEQRKVEQEYVRLRQLLDIDEKTAWRDWKNEWQKEQTVFLRLQELEQEIERYEQAADIEKWQEKRQDISQLIDVNLASLQGACCSLPDHDKAENLQSLQVEFQDKSTQYQELKQRLSELKGSLDVRQKQVKDRHELLAELRICKEQKKQLERRRSSCHLAIEMFEQARKQVQEDVTPRLAPLASKWVSMITKDRYQHCHISPENGFTVRFQEQSSRKWYPVERLSRGTVDQIYFALRLAFVQFFSRKTQPSLHLPLFLDDSFVHFDRSRLQETLKILHHFSQKHQIFICSCHHREREILEQERIPFQRLAL